MVNLPSGSLRSGPGELGQLPARRLQLAPHRYLQPEFLADLLDRHRPARVAHDREDALVVRWQRVITNSEVGGSSLWTEPAEPVRLSPSGRG
ncbi:hypothetical protein ACFVUY_22315 [Kitasatospora sp. NPDC058063]|uniref:hypothetical protein n=1 Tax=unclassified Kitasatospora TaxID=2633591 RepID=UPI0036D8E893